jgi:hypothetical protein
MKPNLQIVILNGKTTGGEKGSPKLKKKNAISFVRNRFHIWNGGRLFAT